MWFTVLTVSVTAGCNTAPTVTTVGGVHIGSPAKVSAGIGVGVVLSRDTVFKLKPQRPFRRDRDVFVMVEPGLKGARASLGYGQLYHARQLGGVYSIRGTVYRRWMSDGRDPGGTYAGVEVGVGGTGESLLGIRVGFLSRVSGPMGRRGTLFTIDMPVGW